MSEREPEEPAGERRYSAVEMRQAERKVRRYGMWVVLALFGGPILLFLLFAGGSMLTMAGSGILGLLVTLIAIPIAFIFNLVQGALVLAIPALVLGGAGYAIYRQYRPSDRRLQTASPELISRFSPQIARLETLRRSTRQETRKRLLIFLPVGLLVAGLVATQLGGGHSDFGLLGRVVAGFVLVGMGAIIPWMLAVSGPHKRYAETFKRELMPALLADRGELRYVEGARVSLAPLVETGLLPRHDRAVVEDAVAGRYRDCDLQISEIELVRKGRRDSTVFRGVVVVLGLTGRFWGRTLVADRDRRAPAGLQAVGLAAPSFDAIYRVYGTDQVEARAVLTPDVMEKMLVIADGGDFFPPFCLVQEGTVTFAMQLTGRGQPFEPPNLEATDAAAQIAHLGAELEAIFGIVDAMIGMHRGLRAAGRIRPELRFDEARKGDGSAS